MNRSTVPERRAWIERVECDASLDVPERIRERADVLERIETYFPVDSATRDTDARRATALRARLEAIDRRLCAELRVELCNGRGRERLMRLATSDAVAGGDRYDHLDDLLSGLLQLDAPGDVADPAGEMVFYQPTPARHAFDLIARTALGAEDVLVDLGSGLGHVPLLVGLCTDARAVGIEVQPAYIERARAAAAALRLERVAFVEQDARVADFAAGTVFYLYTPFSGSILRTVLDALRTQAQRRAIRVCSYGPCTAAIAREAWLESVEAVEADRVAVFSARIR